MKLVADKNIYNVEKAFASLGQMVPLSGRLITPGLELLKDADILLVRSVTPVNAALLDGTQIRFVASASIGVDHVDLDYLRENSIGFAHAPGSSADSVAEYTIAAIFEICAKTKREPRDLTLGIIGAGNVGSRVYKLASAVGMNCVLNDPPKKLLTQNNVYRPLSELLEKSDIVTLHVPLVKSGENATYHMVNNEFISQMKEGSALINTSRGRIVDEENLSAMRKRLGFVVLDVFENEPAISIDTLKLADIATPHIAGYSMRGKFKGTEMICKSARAFFYRDTQECGNVREETERQIINLCMSEDPVYDCVKSAYSIMQDDEKLRGIYAVPENERTKYFDNLRINYPKRLEFEEFTAELLPSQKEEAQILQELRFNVAVGS